MKGRESGMPDEELWTTFFDPECLLSKLCPPRAEGDFVEFGSGYGTFTIAAAHRTSGSVHALDIEPGLIAALHSRCAAGGGPGNVRPLLRDFVTSGTGFPASTMQHAMIFNILHIEEPVAILREACRVLQPGGTAGIIHWRSDIPTPRGPSLHIRPTAELCAHWARDAGFVQVKPIPVPCCPFHYALLASKYPPE